MQKQVLLAFAVLFTIVSGFSATLESGAFFVPNATDLYNQMFQTRKGIITGTNSAQYFLLELQTGNATCILADVVSSCDSTLSHSFDRLHYQATTATLVYYCLRNNSILILDEDDYSVKNAIQVQNNISFVEVQITSEDYGVTILGISNEVQVPSELIKIDLQSLTITTNIVFGYGLTLYEHLYGYSVDSKNNQFVLTQTYNRDTNRSTTTIYSMTSIKNSYQLTAITTFEAEHTQPQPYPLFFCVGELLFLTSNNTLIVMDQKGNIISQKHKLQVRANLPQLVLDYTTNDLYGLVLNTTSPSQLGDVTVFSVQGSGFKADILHYSNLTGIIQANQTQDTLYYTVRDNLFSIYDSKTSEAVFQTVTAYDWAPGLLVSNSSYAYFYTMGDYIYIFIFSRETHTLLAQYPLLDLYYYNPEEAILCYLSEFHSGPDFKQYYNLTIIDIKTGVLSMPLTLSLPIASDFPDPYLLFATTTSSSKGPELTIAYDEDYHVTFVSQTVGQVDFDPDSSDAFGYYVIDFEKLSFYVFDLIYYEALLNVTVYSYDQQNLALSIQNQTTFPYSNSFSSFYGTYSEINRNFSQVAAFGSNFLGVFDLPSLNQTSYPLQGSWDSWDSVSTVQDQNGTVYTIVSNTHGAEIPMLLYGGNQSQLYGASGNTAQAGGAGLCLYWIIENRSPFGVVRFYNVCNEDMSEIYA